MLSKVVRLARNPAVQKFFVWAAPIILGWFLKKIDQKTAKSETPKKHS